MSSYSRELFSLRIIYSCVHRKRKSNLTSRALHTRTHTSRARIYNECINISFKLTIAFFPDNNNGIIIIVKVAVRRLSIFQTTVYSHIIYPLCRRHRSRLRSCIAGIPGGSPPSRVLVLSAKCYCSSSVGGSCVVNIDPFFLEWPPPPSASTLSLSRSLP